MDKVFVDIDVIIDFLTDRKPFSEAAAKIFALSEKGFLDLYISSLSTSNIYYVLKRLESHHVALHLLERLSLLVTVLPVDGKIVYQALTSGFRDFEDALQNFTAVQLSSIHLILTRNVDDYKKSNLIILTPQEYLASI